MACTHGVICTRGEEITPPGESGVYFICLYGKHKGNHCRFSRWCKEERHYVAASDKNGNVCADFSLEPFIREEIEQSSEEIVIQPIEKPSEKGVEEVDEKLTEKLVEEVVVQSNEKIVEDSSEESLEDIFEKIEDFSDEPTAHQSIVEKIVEDISRDIDEKIITIPTILQK